MTHVSLGGGVEFDRIRAIIAALGADGQGLGDDTAILPAAVGELVLSIDASVEAVHFRREWLTNEEVGWRAAAAALSDLAAAAAQPVGLLVALGVPPGTTETDLVEVMRGVAGAGRAAGCPVIGGDLTSSAQLMLTVSAVGRASRPLSRRGSQPGDGIWVTGTLGGARAALVEWEAGRVPPPGARLAFARPQSRHHAARWLAGQGATAMMDISDGLAGDAPHLAAASGVGLEIALERLPLHPSVHAVAARTGEGASSFAAIGGEDYELLVTLPAAFAAGSQADAATGVSLTRIGTVVRGSGARFLAHGTAVALEGFRHFT